MGVFKGVLLNGAANVVLQIVHAFDQLLLVPFFLMQWGAEYYGEWLTLSIIPAILRFSDLGFGASVANSFVLAYTSGDKEKAASIVKNGFLMTTGSVVIGIVLTIVVMLIIDSNGLLDKSAIDANDAMLAVTLMMTAKFISFYSNLVTGFYRSEKKAHIATFILSAKNAINVVVGLIILLAGYKVVGYASSLLIVESVGSVVIVIFGFRVISLDGQKGSIDKSILKSLFIKGLGYFLIPITNTVFFQGSTFIVRVFLGAESVAIFNTLRTLCRSFNQVFSIITKSVFPDMQYAYGHGNIKIVQQLFRVAVLVSSFIAVVGVLFFLFFGLDLYMWWTQNVLAVDYQVWSIFVISIVFNAVWNNAFEVYTVINKPYRGTIILIIVSSFSVMFCYVLVGMVGLGLIGAVFSYVLFDAIMMLFVFPNACSIYKVKLKDIINFDDVAYVIEHKILCKKRQ
ncbi:MAG: hypothetical protein J6Y82_11040 [Bacteroidales bacterium]|nr:hypothetical protein [Bacteroidales bacterium]